MVAPFGRITGQREHMAHPHGGHAEQFALEADHVAVTAAQMKQRGDASLLEHRRHGKVADPEDGERIVRQRDGVASGFRQRLGRGEEFLQGEGLRRVEFGDDDGLPLGHQIENAFLRGSYGNFRRLARRDDGPSHGPRLESFQGGGEGLDVLGRGAAATSDQCCAGLDHAAAEIGEIFRRRPVGDAAFLIEGAAGIREDGKGAGRGDLLHQA